MSTTHTPAPWNRNIKPATKYPTVYSGRNKHVARVVVEGLPEEEIEANANLIAAAPELLGELQKAHQIIQNALNIMTPEQKSAWSEKNARDGVNGEGATRANERSAIIAYATGAES